MRGGHVVIDRSAPAYAVLVALPEGTSPPTARASALEVLAWAAFIARPEDPVRRAILHDEYCRADLAAELARLLSSAPGVPFGVTWNGGLALTYADYRAAERRLAAWRADPAAYAAAARSPAGDPLDPRVHLGPARR